MPETHWKVGAEVIRVDRNKFDKEITRVRRGAIAKFHKNGNFVVQWGGEQKPDPQQYRCTPTSDEAWTTGDYDGRLTPFTEEAFTAAVGALRADRARRSIRRLCHDIVSHDLRSCSDTAVVAGHLLLVNAAEQLGLKTS